MNSRPVKRIEDVMMLRSSQVGTEGVSIRELVTACVLRWGLRAASPP